jgi:nucleoside 2-deoxyribosyltransferase
MNIYIVGPLFSEAEVKQRKYEGKKVRDFLDSNKINYEIFNPIDLNFGEELSSNEIALSDYQGLSHANHVFLDLSTEDSGSCVALGLLIEKMNNGQNVILYPVFSDIRLTRNNKSGLESTKGHNSMVVGIIKGHNIQIYNSFENAFVSFKKNMEIV